MNETIWKRKRTDLEETRIIHPRQQVLTTVPIKTTVNKMSITKNGSDDNLNNGIKQKRSTTISRNTTNHR